MKKVLAAILWMGLVAGAANDAKAAAERASECFEAVAAENWANAYALCSASAEQGDADAQNKLGVMYDNGEGVAQDYAVAVSWYRKAADQGNARAQSNLGLMYANGDGVAQDYVQAHKWLNLAAAGATDATVRDAAKKFRDEIAAEMQPA